MAIISLTAEELQGRQLLDETGRGIGAISDLYVDDDGRPHWLLVDTGFFPGFFSVIPVTDVLVTDKGLEVHYSMEKLTGAPNNMKDKDYAQHREGLLYDYYRLEAPEGLDGATRHGEADKVLKGVTYCKDAYDAAAGADCLVFMTEWNQFRNLEIAKIREAMKTPAIADLRNIYEPKKMREAGFQYVAMGR